MATLFTKFGFLLAFLLSLTQLCLTAQITAINQTTPINTTITYADEFSFSCLPLTTQLSDPIVSPGRQSLHTHVITGGTAFQRTMGIQTARNARETTCEVALDRSNYWVPALYHETDTGSFEMVEYEWSAVYYFNRACNYAPNARTCPDGAYPLAPPAGLRVVAGDSMLQTYDDSDFAQRAISHMCIGKNGISNETKHLPRQPCEKLRSQVFFPSCWDGENLDSLDHKSHVAYPAFGDYNKGVCPESHPVAIFSIFVEFVFNTEPFPNYHKLLYATGDRIGYGLHGDFINGWADQTALHSAFETCTGKRRLQDPGCSITKTQTRPVAALSLKPEVPILWTELGQNRTIPVLPGHPEHAY
ncbi:hypothetical protein BDW72DRAFT_205311 [Aspergillus terricola var. indicus]